MTIEKTTDFIKITPDDGKYILSLNDNMVSPGTVYLSYIDDINNYTEISENEITPDMIISW